MNVIVIPSYIGGRKMDHNRSKLSSIRTMKGRCPFMEMGAETLQRHRGLEGGISHMQLCSPTISRAVNLNEGWHVDFLSRSFLVLTACRCYHFINCPILSFLAPWGFWKSLTPTFQTLRTVKKIGECRSLDPNQLWHTGGSGMWGSGGSWGTE